MTQVAGSTDCAVAFIFDIYASRALGLWHFCVPSDTEDCMLTLSLRLKDDPTAESGVYSPLYKQTEDITDHTEITRYAFVPDVESSITRPKIAELFSLFLPKF